MIFQMKSGSNGSWLCGLVLCLTAGSGFSTKATHPIQDEDIKRKIVSEDFTKSRKSNRAKGKSTKSRPTYRLVSNPGELSQRPTAANSKQLGVTIWRLRPARNGDSERRALIREKQKGTVAVAERVESEAILNVGDYLRLTVESPRIGYLYVINRDVLADGTNGVPNLIFPWKGADNQLAPGKLIDIPRQEDDPSYFTARLTSANQVGELLTFIVTTAPLNVPIADEVMPLALKDVIEWERLWGRATERYEMEGGAGTVWTVEEQKAGLQQGRRRLTRDDPVPQTIYRVFSADSRGLLVNLQLKYRQ